MHVLIISTAIRDPSKTLLENVLKVLELPTLPQKDAAFDASADVECGICYAYHLAHSDHTTPAQTTSKDQIPSQICNNDTCGRAFHHRCLYEVRQLNFTCGKNGHHLLMYVSSGCVQYRPLGKVSMFYLDFVRTVTRWVKYPDGTSFFLP